MDNKQLREFIDQFKADDAKSVDEFNNSTAWSGPSIERQLSFLSWRLVRALDLLVVISEIVAAEQPHGADATHVAPVESKS